MTQEFLKQLEVYKDVFLKDVYEMITLNADRLTAEKQAAILAKAREAKEAMDANYSWIEETQKTFDQNAKDFQKKYTESMKTIESQIHTGESRVADSYLSNL